MPQPKTIGQKFALVFSVTLLIQIFVGFGAYTNSESQVGHFEWISHTQEVMHALDSLETNLMSAETGQRGFLLTGVESYLAPYESALPKIDQDFEHLRELTLDEAARHKLLETLKPATDRKLVELNQTIETRRKMVSRPRLLSLRPTVTTHSL